MRRESGSFLSISATGQDNLCFLAAIQTKFVGKKKPRQLYRFHFEHKSTTVLHQGNKMKKKQQTFWNG